MWTQLLTLLAARRPEPPSDEGAGWHKLIFPLVIMILYGLSSLVKRKQEKQSQRPQPSTEREAPPQRTTRTPLPSYARKTRDVRPERTVQTEEVPQPVRRPAATAQRPAPARPITVQPAPRRVQRTARPRPPQARPVPAAPQKPRRIAVPSEVAQARTEVASAKPRRVASSARRVSSRALAEKQMMSTQEAQELRDTRREQDVRVEGGSVIGRLQLPLQGADDLARAVVYAEILGKPMGLQPRGSFEFLQ